MKRFKIKAIEKIAKQVSKIYGLENHVCVELMKRDGTKLVQVRTELVSYDGGDELINRINKLGYHVENCGGCVYEVYFD